KNVGIANITLHIGMGTFSTIKTDDINKHKMHSELFCIPENTCDLIKKCKENNGKVIAVGTTVARALESFYCYQYESNKFYETNIFIKPGYDFKIVDSLITNFHLPKSSLLIMISAFYNTEKVLKAYKYAIENNYKFFSYGDSTLIL
ncbi:S-adenosylmethionine:tRNA ribosyltransferase-isomerase, partial [Gammaproteobacteria bacterium]|nr:S-adenosylmethionine:tRNA ribosyltransferase-isomerase [Gammaproteobacteria bacterium]